ncbi:DMT family transporter [Paenibacillus yanchengensis]|uniref:DMT family transporter n=1 Tax=Paenibacillus yanchengensis TaxID=2035833 RepID=A0ABW4YP26_9BACL
MNKRTMWMGAALCLIASISWGAMFPVSHIALQQIDPFYFSFIRYFLVAIILTVLLLVKEGKKAFKLEGKTWQLIGYGTLAFTVYNMCIFAAQSMMGEPGSIAASISEVLMPMISVVIVWVATRKAPKRYTITSVLLALVGALLVITNGKVAFFQSLGQHILPLLLMVIAVVSWVFYSMGGEKFASWSTLRYSTLTCIFGSIISFVVVSVASISGLLTPPTVQTLFAIKYEMAFMVLIPGLVALLSWNLGIKMLGSINGILFINAVPITTFIIMAFQGYNISAFEIYGTALIIFALVRNNMMQRKADVIVDQKQTLQRRYERKLSA